MSSDLFKQNFDAQMDKINRDIVDKSFEKIIMQDMSSSAKSETLIVLSEHGLTHSEFDLIIKKKKDILEYLYKEFPEEFLF